MNNPSPLSDKDRADLVAYLDGDPSLDRETARKIQTRLSLDPMLRAEADTLKRTWDLLDYLPRAEPSPKFTHRTLNRVSTRETRKVLRQTRHRRRWLWGAGWAAAVLVVGLAGYLAALALFPPRPSEQDLVRDLRLIENLRYYEQVETLDFLHELDQRDLFGEDSQDS